MTSQKPGSAHDTQQYASSVWRVTPLEEGSDELSAAQDHEELVQGALMRTLLNPGSPVRSLVLLAETGIPVPEVAIVDAPEPTPRTTSVHLLIGTPIGTSGA